MPPAGRRRGLQARGRVALVFHHRHPMKPKTAGLAAVALLASIVYSRNGHLIWSLRKLAWMASGAACLGEAPDDQPGVKTDAVAHLSLNSQLFGALVPQKPPLLVVGTLWHHVLVLVDRGVGAAFRGLSKEGFLLEAAEGQEDGRDDGKDSGKGLRPLAPSTFAVLNRHLCKDRQMTTKTLARCSNTMSHQGNADQTHGAMTPHALRMAAARMWSQVRKGAERGAPVRSCRAGKQGSRCGKQRQFLRRVKVNMELLSDPAISS